MPWSVGADDSACTGQARRESPAFGLFRDRRALTPESNPMSSISGASGVSQAVAYAVARQSMDAWKAQGQSAVALIGAAAEVTPGKPSSPASGRLDVTG